MEFSAMTARLRLCAEGGDGRLVLGFEQLHATLAHGLGKGIEQFAAVFPADAGVGNALAVDERLARHQVLAAGFEMAFEHDTEYAVLPRGELTRDILTNFHLILRIFARVSMAEINHQTLRETRLSERFGCGIDARRIVIWRLAAAQDNVAVLVARGRDDCRVAA